MTSSAIGKSTSCTSGTFLFEGTIKENFEAYYGVLREKPPYLDQMREALRRAALPISIETDCRSLSGGERQRAYLALFLSFPLMFCCWMNPLRPLMKIQHEPCFIL